MHKKNEGPIESHNYGIPAPRDLTEEEHYIGQIVLDRARKDPSLYTAKSPQEVEAEVRRGLGLE